MIVYPYKNAIYLNITNRCPCSCVYCIKFKWGWNFRGHDLKLKKEPTFREVINEVNKVNFLKPSIIGSQPSTIKKVIFCGYGEPFMRFTFLKKLAARLKGEGCKIRVNTTGLGNLINGRDVLPELSGIIDSISVSLNAASPEEYQKINRSIYGEAAFYEVIEFVKKAKKNIPEVGITAIDFTDLDIGKIKSIAKSLGVKYRARPYLSRYENR